MQGEELKRAVNNLEKDVKQSFEGLKQDLDAHIFPFLDQHHDLLDEEHKRKLQIAKDYCKYRKSVAGHEDVPPLVECTSTTPGKNEVLHSRFLAGSENDNNNNVNVSPTYHTVYGREIITDPVPTCAVTPVCQAFADRASFIQACEDIANVIAGKLNLKPVDHLRVLAACFTPVLYRPDLLEKNQFLALKFSSLEAVSDLLNQALIECKDLDVERYIERAQASLQGHSGRPYTVVRVTLEKSVFGGQSFGHNLVAEGYVIHPDEGRNAFTVGVLPKGYK